MKASEQEILYKDLVGDAVADLATQPKTHESYLQYFTEKFNIDSEIYEVVGIELYGIKEPSLSLICEDKSKSTDLKKHITKIDISSIKFKIEDILEGLHIVLYKNDDEIYKDLNPDEEITL